MEIPLDLLKLVASFLVKQKTKLLDWIPENTLNWYLLSKNSNAIYLLEKHFDKINWENLSMNSNAIHILEKNFDKIDWHFLSKNNNAMHLLEKYPDKIDWQYLSLNNSEKAMHLFMANPDKMQLIRWYWLLQNPNVEIFNNMIKPNIHTQPSDSWAWILVNPNIFELDKKQTNKEITRKAWFFVKTM